MDPKTGVVSVMSAWYAANYLEFFGVAVLAEMVQLSDWGLFLGKMQLKSQVIII